MGVFDHAEFDSHESLHFFNDSATGLNAIIALHSTVLGPAAGGCRRWTYTNDADALTDALRLSRGMTYKNAVAGLKFGGGKAVSAILCGGRVDIVRAQALHKALCKNRVQDTETRGGTHVHTNRLRAMAT